MKNLNSKRILQGIVLLLIAVITILACVPMPTGRMDAQEKELQTLKLKLEKQIAERDRLIQDRNNAKTTDF